MAIGGDFSAPATTVVAVTPSDSTDLTGARAFYVGTAGDVAIKTIHGASNTTAVTLSSVPAGAIVPIQVTRIMSTNTTASNIIALY